MYQLIVQMMFMSISYYFFEILIERNLGIREKLFKHIGKVLTWLLGTAITVGLLYLIYPYRESGVQFAAMFGAVFGFYFYAAVYKLSEFVRLIEE